MQILRDRGYLIKERGVIQVKGKGEMLTSYVLGRKISRSWHFGRTVSSGNTSLAQVVYGMVRAKKRRTGRRGRQAPLNALSDYRVTMVVVHLGWVDSDLESSPAGGQLLQLPSAQQVGGTS